MIGIKWKSGFVAAAAMLVALGGCGRDSTASNKSQSKAVQAATISEEKIQQSLAAAQEYFDAGELEKAAAILATLITRAPEEFRAREMYGQVLTAQGIKAEQQRDRLNAQRLRIEAYGQYMKAVELRPSDAGLQQSAGMMALRTGQTEAALDHFRIAGKLDPANPQCPLFEAQLLISKKDYEAARTALGRVLEIDPDAAVAHASLAMIDLDSQNFEAARSHIAVARQIEPANIDFRAQEARIYRKQGDSARVLQLLLPLPAAEQAREIVTFELAAAYSDLGEHLKAARVWENSFRMSPASPNAWLAATRVGEALLRAGKPEDAAKWLQQAKLAAGDAQDAPEILALEESIRR